MGRDVDQHMQAPSAEFPEGSLQEEPDDHKYAEKYDQTVGDIVEVMDVEGNRRFRRSAMTEIWLRRQSKGGSYPEHAE